MLRKERHRIYTVYRDKHKRIYADFTQLMLSTQDVIPQTDCLPIFFNTTLLVPLNEPIKLGCPSTSVHWPHVMQRN
jgi:hypothetical protein